MFYRLSSVISSRRFQVWQIASWRCSQLSLSTADDCSAFRRHCPRILAATTSAISTLSPKEAGTLSSVLRKCVHTLAIFLIQQPTIAEIQVFNAELKDFILSRCPNIEIHDFCFAELALFMRTVMRLHCEMHPQFAIGMEALRSIQTYTEICEAARLNRTFTARIELAMFHEELPLLQETYGFRQMVAFTRAYRCEGRHRSGEFPFPLLQPVEFGINETEAEYRGVGERIALATFCKPAEAVPKDTECSVCIAKVDGTEQDQDEQPVLTKCGHLFHRVCLDNWVNDSAMKASNTCPSCRTVLCNPRQRAHASVGAEPVTLYHVRPSYDVEELPSPGDGNGIADVGTSSMIEWSHFDSVVLLTEHVQLSIRNC
ncbi:hypothetical protein EJ07DRAFT_158092 [Lizonia empirigonia]|nr:hypothetical protein EJ07DRAFT_158092 [Lizonia empirigonia]